MKHCHTCGTDKELSQFYKRHNTTDGLQTMCIDCTKQYKLDNREQILAYQKEYKQKYPHLNAKKEAKRRASKLNATPAWLTEDDDFIFNEIYEMRAIRSNDTGVTHHVDHIVPLQGKDACGLHVWWNMQLLPASENISKSNAVGGYSIG